jgi:probable phosphoglycerate mutase
MPIFLLIRHGETEFNKKKHLAGRLPNVHLTKRGQKQAQLLAEKLSSVPIKAIYASPLERTMDTAQPLASALKLEITPLDDLLETDCGDWQGQSVRTMRRKKEWKLVQQHPSLFHFPSGESIAECQHRMVRAMETIRLRHSPHDIVACFCHADPIKQAVAFYIGLPLDNFQRLAIDVGSITVMHITENGSRLIALNYNPAFAWDTLQPPDQKKTRKS